MADIDIFITLDGTFITGKSTVTAVSGDFVQISDTSDSGNLKKVDVSAFLGGGVTNLSLGAVTPTTVDIDSDTGTDATIPSATASDAGVMPAADKTKLDFISVTQAVDLDTMESDISTNNAKVSNATHTGDVTGSGALTIGAKKVLSSMMEDGTDGELFTWDALGVISKVAVGASGQVLTSNGVGTKPTFQSGGGTDTICYLFFTTAGVNLADTSVYHLGWGTALTTNINGFVHVAFPAGTITRVMINANAAGTIGSSEEGTLDMFTNSGATDDEITATMKIDTSRNTFQDVTGLSITAEAGLAYIKFTAPTWATNPTAVKICVAVFIEPS